MPAFKIFRQLEMSDCGETCIQMICAYYGKKHPLHSIKNLISISRIGVTIGDIKRTCEQLGFFTVVAKGDIGQLGKITTPIILHWRGNHFVILHKITVRKNRRIYHIADPSYGKIKFTEDEFVRHWYTDSSTGLVSSPHPPRILFQRG